MKSHLSPPLLCLFSFLAVPYQLKFISKCNIIICALISVISLIFHVLRYVLFSALSQQHPLWFIYLTKIINRKFFHDLLQKSNGFIGWIAQFFLFSLISFLKHFPITQIFLYCDPYLFLYIQCRRRYSLSSYIQFVTEIIPKYYNFHNL